ncbi:unnamed protein product, partial [Clonostachys rosea f. rosea IK726]
MKSFKKIRDKLIKPNSAAVVKSSSVAGKDNLGRCFRGIQSSKDRCKELTSLSKDSQLIDTIDRLILKFGPIGTLAASIAPSNPELNNKHVHIWQDVIEGLDRIGNDLERFSEYLEMFHSRAKLKQEIEGFYHLLNRLLWLLNQNFEA